MARLTDSNGNLVGGLEMSLARLLSPLNETETAAFQTSGGTPILSLYGPKETVRWLECSYGDMNYVTYSSAGSLQALQPDNLEPRHLGCHNQIDKPHKRSHCEACGGDYCQTHAEPEAHDCASILRAEHTTPWP